MEIHEGRANANKLMARYVRDAITGCEARLASWHGGNMRNAIPFECEVVLTLPKENIEAAKELEPTTRRPSSTSMQALRAA